MCGVEQTKSQATKKIKADQLTARNSGDAMTPPEPQPEQKPIRHWPWLHVRHVFERFKGLFGPLWKRIRDLFRLKEEHTGELTYTARITSIAIAVVITFGIFAYTPADLFDNFEFLQGSDAVTELGVFLFLRFVAAFPVFLAVWLIRTDDKKVEFQLAQRDMVQSQVNEALGLLQTRNPSFRDIGITLLTDLYNGSTLEGKKYHNYMNLAKAWKDIEDQDG